MSLKDARHTAWAWAAHYLFAALTKSWNSSITAVDAQAIQTPNWAMIGYVFGVKYATSIIKYFAENPIPTTLESRMPKPNETPSA